MEQQEYLDFLEAVATEQLLKIEQLEQLALQARNHLLTCKCKSVAEDRQIKQLMEAINEQLTNI